MTLQVVKKPRRENQLTPGIWKGNPETRDYRDSTGNEKTETKNSLKDTSGTSREDLETKLRAVPQRHKRATEDRVQERSKQ